MHTFTEHLRLHKIANQLAILENFFPIDSTAYDALFRVELNQLAIRFPNLRKELEDLEKFKFTNYISTAVRNSGIADARTLDEKTHDLASQLLLGKLFNGYSPEFHGPFMGRFKTSVQNAVMNLAAKTKTYKRYFPSALVPDQVATKSPREDFEPIEEFRGLVRNRLGALGLAVLDARLNGEETRSLVGSASLEMPSSYAVKQMVIAIKELATEFARQRGDDGFLRALEKALEGEAATVRKRFGGREKVGA